MSFYPLLRKAIFALDPEEAHTFSLKAINNCLFPKQTLKHDEAGLLNQNICGLNFAHPIGLAAGYDKNAEAIAGVFKLGFAFAEFGTLTPKPQSGNDKPRIFRLVEQKALINRLGFNNKGHMEAYKNLQKATVPNAKQVGINIGANKDSSDRVNDYILGVQKFAKVANYLTINISSPNTPGLRDLQEANQLDDLLAKCVDERNKACKDRDKQTPLFVKFAPDLDLASLDAMIKTALMRKIDGLILTNTTIDRPTQVQTNPQAHEMGGLSGEPLFEKSTYILAQSYLRVGNQLPLIGVGGIHSPKTLMTKIQAGATLTQIYTGLIYQGPSLIADLHNALLTHLREQKTTLQAEIGSNAQNIADEGQKSFAS